MRYGAKRESTCSRLSRLRVLFTAARLCLSHPDSISAGENKAAPTPCCGRVERARRNIKVRQFADRARPAGCILDKNLISSHPESSGRRGAIWTRVGGVFFFLRRRSRYERALPNLMAALSHGGMRKYCAHAMPAESGAGI